MHIKVAFHNAFYVLNASFKIYTPLEYMYKLGTFYRKESYFILVRRRITLFPLEQLNQYYIADAMGRSSHGG